MKFRNTIITWTRLTSFFNCQFSMLALSGTGEAMGHRVQFGNSRWISESQLVVKANLQYPFCHTFRVSLRFWDELQ